MAYPYRNKYDYEVAKLKARLAVEQAKLEYFTYLHDVVDLYKDKAAYLVDYLYNPSGLSDDEKEQCQKHIDKINLLSRKLTKVDTV